MGGTPIKIIHILDEDFPMEIVTILSSLGVLPFSAMIQAAQLPLGVHLLFLKLQRQSSSETATCRRSHLRCVLMYLCMLYLHIINMV